MTNYDIKIFIEGALMNIMEKFSLTRKVAIVTGASKGLGRSMAIGLAQAGASVAVVSRTKNLIEETAAEIIRNGGDALAIPTDVTSEDDIERMTALVYEKFGKIDILVNNAGIGGSKISVDLTSDEWDQMMNTNAKSIFMASRAVGKIMIRQKSGKLINITSILGDRPLPSNLHYGASKAAIINMTKSLALEWARFHINVNGIAPGWFLTEMTKDQQEGENQKFLLRRIPFGRFGTPDEIAGLTIFLASPAADYMTGQTVFIDGGYSV
jgi:NAD(P)-dependent dehydrogenase (short-subunit alcohol dehydrogenase family)